MYYELAEVKRYYRKNSKGDKVAYHQIGLKKDSEFNEPKTIDRVIELSKKHIKDKIDINPKDKYIITGGYPFKEVKYTNFMKIEEM